MPEVQTQVSPFMAYEHRDKDGNIISMGSNRIKRGGKIQFVQETGKGVKLYESLQLLSDGRLLEEKFYTDGKETEKLTFAYDEKGELLTVTDKLGVVSLSPIAVEKETIK